MELLLHDGSIAICNYVCDGRDDEPRLIIEKIIKSSDDSPKSALYAQFAYEVGKPYETVSRLVKRNRYRNKLRGKMNAFQYKLPRKKKLIWKIKSELSKGVR